MHRRKFDHALTLKITPEMRDDIDQALARLEGTVIRTRSEFLRSAAQYCLDDLTDANGGVPLCLEERMRRVLSGIGDCDGYACRQHCHHRLAHETGSRIAGPRHRRVHDARS